MGTILWSIKRYYCSVYSHWKFILIFSIPWKHSYIQKEWNEEYFFIYSISEELCCTHFTHLAEKRIVVNWVAFRKKDRKLNSQSYWNTWASNDLVCISWCLRTVHGHDLILTVYRVLKFYLALFYCTLR